MFWPLARPKKSEKEAVIKLDASAAPREGLQAVYDVYIDLTPQGPNPFILFDFSKRGRYNMVKGCIGASILYKQKNVCLTISC